MAETANTGPEKSETSDKLINFPAPGIAAAKRTATIWSGSYWVPATLALVLVLVAAALWWWVVPRTNIRYVTAAATRGAITHSVTATGTVNPQLTIIVGTYVSGVIQEIYCDYNTQVKKGQLCAKIDPRPYQTVVDQNKANLVVAKAQLDKDKAALAYAKVTFERYAALLPDQLAVTQDAYDNAKSNYDQAQSQIAFDEATIQQRQAALDASQVNLDYTDIISPVDGTVVSRNVTIGETVAASFQTPTMFLIATDLTKMQVDTNVSESDVGGIVEGQKGLFTVDAFPKRTFEGVVTQIRQSPQTIQNVVTYDIVVTVDNNDLALKPGLTAATRIITNSRDDAMRVPNAALRYRPSRMAGNAEADRSQVWVLRDGSPTAVAVKTGLDDDNFTEVVDGDLKANDQVIVSEQDAAKPVAAPRF